jgi:hypothetical protein
MQLIFIEFNELSIIGADNLKILIWGKFHFQLQIYYFQNV